MCVDLFFIRLASQPELMWMPFFLFDAVHILSEYDVLCLFKKKPRKDFKSFYFYFVPLHTLEMSEKNEIYIDDCECTLHQQRRYKLFHVKIAR